MLGGSVRTAKGRMSRATTTAEKDLTNRSVIYSLGCVPYEMSAGIRLTRGVDPSPHSALKATNGSTLVDRRAGTYPASTDTKITSKVIPPKVNKSVGATL